MIGLVRSAMKSEREPDGRLFMKMLEMRCPVCHSWRPAQTLAPWDWGCSPTCAALIALDGGKIDFQVELMEEPRND